MKTWIFGNSHMGALNKGLRRIGAQGHDLTLFPLGPGTVEMVPFSRLEAGRVGFADETCARNLRRFTGRDHLDPEARWGVCMGTHNARLCRDPFWIDAEPAVICAPGKRPVPETTVDAIIETDQRHVRDLLARMKQAGLAVFVVSCPPVRPASGGRAAEIRAEVAAWLEARARAAFTGFLAAQKIAFVAPPEGTRDAAGFLSPQFHATLTDQDTRDPHHANPEYGEMMMRKVLAHLDAAASDGEGAVA